MSSKQYIPHTRTQGAGTSRSQGTCTPSRVPGSSRRAASSRATPRRATRTPPRGCPCAARRPQSLRTVRWLSAPPRFGGPVGLRPLSRRREVLQRRSSAALLPNAPCRRRAGPAGAHRMRGPRLLLGPRPARPRGHRRRLGPGLRGERLWARPDEARDGPARRLLPGGGQGGPAVGLPGGGGLDGSRVSGRGWRRVPALRALRRAVAGGRPGHGDQPVRRGPHRARA
mmetsp:Transcript_58735/g.163774  ORF Transcript_58735/g.163774 Transcript_58735/m.163774 type:complete len:227 (-) Transcript_58735:56-736(-)